MKDGIFFCSEGRRLSSSIWNIAISVGLTDAGNVKSDIIAGLLDTSSAFSYIIIALKRRRDENRRMVDDLVYPSADFRLFFLLPENQSQNHPVAGIAQSLPGMCPPAVRANPPP